MRNQSGHSIIEAILLSLLLFVPVLWLVGVLAELHMGALATTAAAREAGFEAAGSADLRSAQGSVSEAVQQALIDHGLDPDLGRVELSAAGLERGATVEVRVRYPVEVLQAPLLGGVGGPVIWVDASHLAVIDPYRSRP